MKKKEFNLLITKPDEHQQEIDLLRTDLEQMDQLFPVFTPDLNWFEQQVEMAKKQARKKLIRDLAIFWIIAICIITVTLLLLYRMPVIYFILQIVAILAFLITSLFIKRKRQVEH